MKRRKDKSTLSSSSSSSYSSPPIHNINVDGSLRLLFGPCGRDMSHSRAELLKTKLASFGIDVASKWKRGKEPTHLVASPYASEEALLDIVNSRSGTFTSIEHLTNTKVVTYEWALALVNQLVTARDQERAAMKRRKVDSESISLKLPDTDLYLWSRARAKAMELQAKERDGDNQGDDEDTGMWERAPQSRQGNGREEELRKEEREEADPRRWLNVIPETYREECKVYMSHGDQLGIKLSKHLSKPAKANHLRTPRDPRESFMAFRSGSEGVHQNMNTEITDELQRLLDYYKATNEAGGWKANSYKKAIDILKSLPFKVSHVEQVRSYRGMGPKILEKINEILRTGKLEKAENVGSSELAKTLKLFTQIHGIGTGEAMKLYVNGFRTIEDLRTPKGQAELSRTQKIGVQFFEDINERIPRSEVKEIGDIVKQTCMEVWPDRGLFGEVAGSYRRGQESCGDVDMIFTTPQHAGCPPLKELIAALHKKGFLIADLTQMKDEESNMYGQVRGKQTYMGLCRLPADPHNPGCRRLARRIDIKIYPREMFAFALIYFTGNAHFNRSLRYYCKTHGMTLSDEGIFPAVRSAHRERIAKGTESLAKCYSEQEVFRFLGFPYKEPSERNCEDQAISKAAAQKKWYGAQVPDIPTTHKI